MTFVLVTGWGIFILPVGAAALVIEILASTAWKTNPFVKKTPRLMLSTVLASSFLLSFYKTWLLFISFSWGGGDRCQLPWFMLMGRILTENFALVAVGNYLLFYLCSIILYAILSTRHRLSRSRAVTAHRQRKA